MIARPVAEFLIHFGNQAEVVPALDLCAEATMTPIWKQELEEDLETALESARESGRAAGFEQAQAEFDVKLEAARKEFEQMLAEKRQEWVRTESEQLRDKFVAAFGEMEERIADGLARVLRPLVIDSLRQKTLVELGDQIAAMVGSNEKILIKIAGPSDLLAGLRKSLASAGLAIEYEPQDCIEVSVIAAQTAIETQFKSWIDLIDAGVEQQA